MAEDLKGIRVAILAADGVERAELEQPRGALYGGGANTDLLSTHSGEFAAICHGPWTLIEAGVVADRTLTSWPSLWTDLRHAGAEPVEAAVTDGQFTTSRSPADLPSFCAAIIAHFAGARA